MEATNLHLIHFNANESNDWVGWAGMEEWRKRKQATNKIQFQLNLICWCGSCSAPQKQHQSTHSIIFWLNDSWWFVFACCAHLPSSPSLKIKIFKLRSWAALFISFIKQQQFPFSKRIVECLIEWKKGGKANNSQSQEIKIKILISWPLLIVSFNYCYNTFLFHSSINKWIAEWNKNEIILFLWNEGMKVDWWSWLLPPLKIKIFKLRNNGL